MTEPRSIRTVPGMGGKVAFDFRVTGLCPAKPEVESARWRWSTASRSLRMPGTADFEKLGRILRGKGARHPGSYRRRGQCGALHQVRREVFRPSRR